MARRKRQAKADPTACVIYARFSSERQRDESIEDQVRVCSDWAAGHGLTVVATYEDRAVSGTSDERPEFLRMIADARSGNFGTVLVYKLDRFARDRFDAAIVPSRGRSSPAWSSGSRKGASDGEGIGAKRNRLCEGTS